VAGGARYGARVWVALWIVYLVWGSTYLAIKVAVDVLPPFPMLSVRFVLAGGILFAWCSRRGLPRPTRRQWVQAAIVGTCLAAIGNGGVAFAETRIDSGFVALLVAIVPLWIALSERVFLGRRMSARGVAGIVVGLSGVAFLVDPWNTSSSDLAAALIVLGGTLGWAGGSLYASRTERLDDPLLGVAMQMLAGGAVLAVVGAGQWGQVDPGAVTLGSVAAVAYLVLVGSVIAYTAYGWLLHHAPPSLVATYAYVNPVVAVALGALFAGEEFTAPTAIGGAVIVLAVALIVTAPARPKPAAAPARSEALREAA